MLQAEAIPTTTGVRFAKIKVVCAHGRVIDDLLTDEGEKTGMVRCLECLEIIPDPYLQAAAE